MAEACCPTAFTLPAEAGGSRRRRLWELGHHAHCPVIGVCLPLPLVRQLAKKHLVLQGDEDDYTLHCSLVSASQQRNKLSEAAQRELEQRYELDRRQAAQAKCVDSLMAWWRGRAEQGDVAGALWATLTHPRCNEWLETRVLAQVHMLQHQVGAAQRVDLQRHKELVAEHAALARDYAAVQRRVSDWAQERHREQQAWAAERAQWRATEVGLQAQLDQAREQLARWQAAHEDLADRALLQQRLEAVLQRHQSLQRELQQERQRMPRVDPPPPVASETAPPPEPTPPVLSQRVVLCVGGRGGSVPQYRQAIEGCGAQFLHHDGGCEHKPAQLEPQLAAADLVICQTGCISHDAYWRVKDHCKRHGKRCVFVDKPSASSLRRALGTLDERPPAGVAAVQP